jgi:hypothetical protein
MLIRGRCCSETFLQHATVFVQQLVQTDRAGRRPRLRGDPPYLCNAKKSPATLITYRSAPDFTGKDTAAVQIFFPDGRAPTMLFHLEVR